MNTYPDITCPDVGLEVQHIRPTTRVMFESGYTSTRKRYTSGRTLFSLSYSNITIEEFRVILDFFEENQGFPFKYFHKDGNTTTEYTVLFASNNVPEEIPSGKLRSTKVSFITS